MRKLSVVIFLLTFCISCSDNPFREYEVNLLYVNNLKGKVKSVKSETFEAVEKFGEIEKGNVLFPDKYISEVIPNLIDPNSEYSFNEQGRSFITKLKKRSYYSSSIETSYLKNTYDDSGKNLIRQDMDDNGEKLVMKLEIDNEKPVLGISYTEDGEKDAEWEYVYEEDRVKEVTYKDEYDEVIFKMKYSYENGQQIVVSYNLDGEEVGRYSMGKKGRVVSQKRLDNEQVYVYESDYALPVRMEGYTGKELKQAITATFDDQGNYSKLENKEGTKDPEAIVFTYVYDDQGNWTKCVAYEEDEPIFVTYRTIKYY